MIIDISLWAMTWTRDITARPLQGNLNEAVQVDFVTRATGEQLPEARTNRTYPGNAISTFDVPAFEIETNEDGKKEIYHDISSATEVDDDHNDNGESQKKSLTVRHFYSDKPHRPLPLANLNLRRQQQPTRQRAAMNHETRDVKTRKQTKVY
jgi:hypothetical protein